MVSVVLALGTPTLGHAQARSTDKAEPPAPARGEPNGDLDRTDRTAGTSYTQSFAVRSPISIAAEGSLRLRLDDGVHEPQFGPSFATAYQVAEHLGIGVHHTGFGIVDGGETYVMIGAEPYIEPNLFVDSHVQLFARVGMHFRAYLGDRDGVDLLASTGAGVRFWLIDWLSLGAHAWLQTKLTEARTYIGIDLEGETHTFTESAPQGSVSFGAALMLGFHF